MFWNGMSITATKRDTRLLTQAALLNYKAKKRLSFTYRYQV